MKLKFVMSAIALAAAFATTSADAADKKALAFVVNGASNFWKLAEAGVKKAQGELPNYDLQFKYPEQASAAVQQRLMEDLVARTRALFAEGRPLCDRVGRDLRFEMRLTWLGGWAILDGIERAGYDVFRRRPRHGLAATECVVVREGQRQKPS